MKTQDGDQIIINIVGHNPDGAINATMIQYVRNGAMIGGDWYWHQLRFILSKAIRKWSRAVAKEQ